MYSYGASDWFAFNSHRKKETFLFQSLGRTLREQIMPHELIRNPKSTSYQKGLRIRSLYAKIAPQKQQEEDRKRMPQKFYATPTLQILSPAVPSADADTWPGFSDPAVLAPTTWVDGMGKHVGVSALCFYYYYTSQIYSDINKFFSSRRILYCISGTSGCDRLCYVRFTSLLQSKSALTLAQAKLPSGASTRGNSQQPEEPKAVIFWSI